MQAKSNQLFVFFAKKFPRHIPALAPIVALGRLFGLHRPIRSDSIHVERV